MGLAFSEWAAFIARETNATPPFCLFLSNDVDQKEVVLHVTQHEKIKMSSLCFTIKRTQDEKEGAILLFYFVVTVLIAPRKLSVPQQI